MLSGLIVALVTPFLENGDLDLKSFKRLIHFQIEQGTKGLVIAGTTGEAPTLTSFEQELLIKTAVEESNGKILIFAGVGTYCTRESVEKYIDWVLNSFNFEKIDATEPSIYQYKFITEKFNYYNNVYNLPLEEIDMSEYDTIILSGIWVPNWVEAIKKYILPNENLKNVVITTTLIHNENYLSLDAKNFDPAPWQYCFEGDRKLLSIKMMNLIFKNKSFHLKNSFSRKNDIENHMTSKFYLHYQRD